MKLSLVIGFLWVVASAITAMLPMRRQYVPAIALLLAAPLLLIWLAIDYNLWLVLGGLAAFVSMFRHPLRYLLRRALGKPVELPPELQERGR